MSFSLHARLGDDALVTVTVNDPPHNDHLNELRKGFPIALVSLGATRRMTIRTKAQPRRVIHVDLEAGSLLVMDYATQLHYTHGVPKTTETGGRAHQPGVPGETGRSAGRRCRHRFLPLSGMEAVDLPTLTPPGINRLA